MPDEAQNESQSERKKSAKRKPRGKPFAGKDDPRNGNAEVPKETANSKPLSDERTSDLEAMEHVWFGGAITTKQQQGFKKLRKSDGDSKFWDRMHRLKAGQPEPTPTAQPAEVVPAEAPFPELEEAWGKFQAFCRSNP